MNGKYLKLVIDDVVRDVFPATAFREKPHLLKILHFRGCSLLSSDPEEFTDFQKSLSPGGERIQRDNSEREFLLSISEDFS